jgi:hypothetical protein
MARSSRLYGESGAKKQLSELAQIASSGGELGERKLQRRLDLGDNRAGREKARFFTRSQRPGSRRVKAGVSWLLV